MHRPQDKPNSRNSRNSLDRISGADIRIPTSQENLTEAVQLLHSLFRTDIEIARRLDIDIEDVRYILRHGAVPLAQLAWSWDAVEVQS